MPVKRVITIPNLLSLIRLMCALIMLVLAWLGHPTLFILVLVCAFILDAIDGPIARWLNQVSELGPRIDSWAGFSVYIVFLAGAVLLWPEIVQRELVYIILVACSLILPAVAGIAKFRRPTSYHTWLVKTAAVVMAPSAILLFLGGPAWPFHVATVISVLAALEEILITLYLTEPCSDVGSLIHILNNKHGKR